MKPSAWPDRRARREAARVAEAGRLAAAFRRIRGLEGEVADLQRRLAADAERHRLAAQQAVWIARAPEPTGTPATEGSGLPDPEGTGTLQGELAERLALAVPNVEQVLAEAAAPPDHPVVRPGQLVRSRRNTGLHCGRRRAASIARAGQRELNSIQRGGRHGGAKPRRRAKRKEEGRGLHLAAEAVRAAAAPANVVPDVGETGGLPPAVPRAGECTEVVSRLTLAVPELEEELATAEVGFPRPKAATHQKARIAALHPVPGVPAAQIARAGRPEPNRIQRRRWPFREPGLVRVRPDPYHAGGSSFEVPLAEGGVEAVTKAEYVQPSGITAKPLEESLEESLEGERGVLAAHAASRGHYATSRPSMHPIAVGWHGGSRSRTSTTRIGWRSVARPMGANREGGRLASGNSTTLGGVPSAAKAWPSSVRRQGRRHLAREPRRPAWRARPAMRSAAEARGTSWTRCTRRRTLSRAAGTRRGTCFDLAERTRRALPVPAGAQVVSGPSRQSCW